MAITFILLITTSLPVATVASGSSPALFPKRRFATSLDVQVSPNPRTGELVSITGRLVAAGQVLPNQTVQVAYSRDNQTWTDLSGVTTDMRGEFSVSWTPKLWGLLYLRSLYLGTNEYDKTMLVSAIVVAPSPSMMAGVNLTLWDDSDSRYKETYFDLLKSSGMNTIMINFGWNKLEPTKGSYDQNYLGKMDRFIQKAKARNIYVILRMQKWAYPNAYQAQSPGNAWILGYPAWLNDTPDFWENVGNCWNNYVAMWTMLAARYKNESYAAGFNLFGEPGNDIGPAYADHNWYDWDSNACRKTMKVLFDGDMLYERTINAIHSITNKLIIIEGFDGSALRYIKNAGDTNRTLARKPQAGNFAVGQSVYDDFQFPWLDEQKSIATAWNVPYMDTEFGVKVTLIASPEPGKVTWVQQACQAFAARNMGWFYWEFGPGPNGDYNLVNENDGSVSPILTNILPPYARAMAP